MHSNSSKVNNDGQCRTKCVEGCGFWGSPTTANRCSKCFSRHQETQSEKQSITTVKVTNQAVSVSSAPNTHDFDETTIERLTPSHTISSQRLSSDRSPVHGPSDESIDSLALTTSTTSATTATKTSLHCRVPNPVKNDGPTDNVITDQNGQPVTTEGEDEEDMAQVQQNVKRCWNCNKKHGVLGFKCRCGFVFCDQHRHRDQHDCGYTGWEDDRTSCLKKQLVKVAKDRIKKI